MVAVSEPDTVVSVTVLPETVYVPDIKDVPFAVKLKFGVLNVNK